MFITSYPNLLLINKLLSLKLVNKTHLFVYVYIYDTTILLHPFRCTLQVLRERGEILLLCKNIAKRKEKKKSKKYVFGVCIVLVSQTLLFTG